MQRDPYSSLSSTKHIIPRLLQLPSGPDVTQLRAITKISSCWVYALSRQGIEELGSSFGSILQGSKLQPINFSICHWNIERSRKYATK